MITNPTPNPDTFDVVAFRDQMEAARLRTHVAAAVAALDAVLADLGHMTLDNDDLVLALTETNHARIVAARVYDMVRGLA
jgi:hypothetical protein